MRRFLILVFTSACAIAQTGNVHFPALGFAADQRSSQIRPILGIPGATLLGDPLDAGSFTGITISPRQDMALAISKDDHQVYLVPFAGSPAQVIPDAIAAPSRIVFSPSGNVAAVWGSKFQVLTQLSGNPRVTEVNSFPVAAAAGMAVSDDAQALMVSTGQEGDPVWLFSADGGPAQLSLPGSVQAIAFRRDSRDAIAVTRSGDVYWVGNAGMDAEIRQLYPGDEQTSDPVAVQISRDGTKAFTANSRGTVTSIELKTGSVVSVSCHCSPAAMEPLQGASLYRLTEISDRPVMLFDASTSEPRIWFVPAATPSSDQRSSQ